MGEAGLEEMLAALEAPAPSAAGGSAAALAGAAAASLVIMAGRGSPGWKEGTEAAGAAARLRARLLQLGEDDTAALATMIAAWRTRDESAAGMRLEATLRAIEVPCEIARQAAEVASLAARAAGAGKRVMAADVAVAALLAEAATRAAALIVSVNATLLRRGPDAELAAPFEQTVRTAETDAADACRRAVQAAGA